MKPYAQVRCIFCRTVWWVGPGEVAKGDMPQCPESSCHGFGVSTGKAKTAASRPQGA